MAKNWYPTVDDSLCIESCNICINFCPTKVFIKNNGIAKVENPDACIQGCKGCEPICPEKAIQFLTSDNLRIDDVDVAIEKLDKALSMDTFEKGFKVILDNNYIPDSAIDKFKMAFKKRYDNEHNFHKKKCEDSRGKPWKKISHILDKLYLSFF